MKVYQKLAGAFNAMLECKKRNNTEWEEKHQETIEQIINNNLPSGSGIDSGNKFDYDNSKDNKLIINSSYHAMDENGFCDGWIDYKIIIKPSLIFGIELNIYGNFGKHQDLKDMLIDSYHYTLTQDIE